jgi:hypothetical protein
MKGLRKPYFTGQTQIVLGARAPRLFTSPHRHDSAARCGSKMHRISLLSPDRGGPLQVGVGALCLPCEDELDHLQDLFIAT